ncbi:hypothetical protein RRG08_040231 [Elysia crispata]|uniref:Uncharacterized protein n=1 Tax=Elysia crispata TaxID=231223 RepID=A0AAE1CYP4_9GAST|nr:hypothetical protein RRG08_040231 [Elysia crispata]
MRAATRPGALCEFTTEQLAGYSLAIHEVRGPSRRNRRGLAQKGEDVLIARPKLSHALANLCISVWRASTVWGEATRGDKPTLSSAGQPKPLIVVWHVEPYLS